MTWIDQTELAQEGEVARLSGRWAKHGATDAIRREQKRRRLARSTGPTRQPILDPEALCEARSVRNAIARIRARPGWTNWDRYARILEMLLEGRTVDEIAEECGYRRIPHMGMSLRHGKFYTQHAATHQAMRRAREYLREELGGAYG